MGRGMHGDLVMHSIDNLERSLIPSPYAVATHNGGTPALSKDKERWAQEGKDLALHGRRGGAEVGEES